MATQAAPKWMPAWAARALGFRLFLAIQSGCSRKSATRWAKHNWRKISTSALLHPAPGATEFCTCLKVCGVLKELPQEISSYLEV